MRNFSFIGGKTAEIENGGSEDQCGKNLGGVSILRPTAAAFRYPSPPQDVVGTFSNYDHK